MPGAPSSPRLVLSNYLSGSIFGRLRPPVFFGSVAIQPCSHCQMISGRVTSRTGSQRFVRDSHLL